MLMLNDLTPWSLKERVDYDLDLGWWIKFCIKAPTMKYGYRIIPARLDDFMAVNCETSVSEDMGCTLRKNHSGPCLSWHPERGLLKVASWDFPL